MDGHLHLCLFCEDSSPVLRSCRVVGLVMGGIQTLSRSTYSKMLPEGTLDTTSYFSFYDVSEKIGIVIGMLLYGMVTQIFGSIRLSILFLTAFFLIGVILIAEGSQNRKIIQKRSDLKTSFLTPWWAEVLSRFKKLMLNFNF